MPRIPSPVIGHEANPTGSAAQVDQFRRFVIFELLNVDHETVSVPQSQLVFPYLVLHVNPNSWEESYTKLINRQITRGGYLEQHWGEELDSITCSGSTGLFLTVANGLSALNRKASIAYRKYLDLISLYKNNGLVYDQRGNPVLYGGIALHFDGNIYQGYFESFGVQERADNPFTFELTFTFKVKHQHRSLGA